MIGSKKAGFAACVVSLALILVGCGSGSNGFTDSSTGSNALLGSWIKRGLSYQGRAISCPNSIDASLDRTVAILTLNNVVLDSCGYNEKIIFNNDGTYEIVVPAPRLVKLTDEQGTFTVAGDVVTLTRTSLGYDANGDNQITSAETTTLASVSDPNNVPANAQQRAVFHFSVDADGLHLTSIPQQIKDGSGAYIVTSGAINAIESGTTESFGRAQN